MNWYHMLYERPSGAVDRPDPPRPKGLKLLGYIFVHQWWNLIWLNILFWAFSLPVITLPAALKAMTKVCVTMLEEDRVELWREFWGAFREDFLKTTLVGAAMAAMVGLCAAGLWVCGGLMAINGLFAAPAMLLLIALAVLIPSQFSLYPMLAFSELSAGKLLRNAILLTMVNLPRHLGVLVLLVILVVLYLVGYPYSTVALAAILLSAFWLCACFAVWPGIKRLVFRQGESDR